MATRGGFPELDLREQGSPDVQTFNHSADVSPGLGQLAAAAGRLGETLQGMAEDAAGREGTAQAAADIAAGVPKPTGGTTVRAKAYDQTATRFLASQQKATITELMAKAYSQSPDNPAELAKGLDAARAGLKPTGVAELDAEVAGQWTILRSDYIARAIAGARQATIAQGKANFLQDLQTGQETLDQVAAGATFDAGGASRVGAATQGFVATLSRYGPKEAFSVAGLDLPADPTRADALTPAEMAGMIQKGISQGRKTWVLAYADSLTSEPARRAFAADVATRWKAGDAAFHGLDGEDMGQLQRQLEAGADRLHTETRAGQAEAAQRARDGIEAFTWGQDVDFNRLLADAEASGDAGLAAQARFYRDADPETRGVLRSVVARQLGLLGEGGPGDVWVDPTGKPIGGATAGRLRGDRNNNPGNLKALAGGEKWLGQTGVDADGFAVFATAQAGAAAAKTNLRSYARQGFDTIQEIVARWAPAGDGTNNPAAYAATVAQKLHVAPTAKLNMADPAVIEHLAEAMFDVETPGRGWRTPATVAPGTPAYAAWASTREGFTSDPLAYARGGKTRPGIANVPVLVPEAAFAEGAPAQAWAQGFAQRWALGQGLARTYGVPTRTLTNGEKAFYLSQLQADPMKGIGLAQAARLAAGPEAALALMRELGDTPLEASAALHIADLAAGGSSPFARSAAQGLALQAEGAKIPDALSGDIAAAFDKVRGAIPAPVMQAARAAALAAAVADHKQGVDRPAAFYLRSALGATSWNGRTYGGPAEVNGARTVLPRWLAADQAEEALETIGELWSARGVGPVWANGEPVDGRSLANMQLALQPSGVYRLVNPRTGNPLMARSGRPFEADLDRTRGFIAERLGSAGARPANPGAD